MAEEDNAQVRQASELFGVVKSGLPPVTPGVPGNPNPIVVASYGLLYDDQGNVIVLAVE